jgi:hypothetical protein
MAKGEFVAISGSRAYYSGSNETGRPALRRTRWIVSVALALSLGVGCSDSRPGDRSEDEGEARLTGRILATGFGGDDDLVSYDLESRETTRLPVPEGMDVFDAFWGPGGETAYMLASPSFSRVRLYETSPGADPAPLGRTFTDPEAEILSVRGSMVLATECERNPKLLLMDLEGSRRWKEVAPGCAGTLTSDGRSVLYAMGRKLWQAPLAGGPAREVADLAIVEEDGEPIRTSRIFDVRYAPSAIVATVGVDDRFYPAVGRQSARFELIRLENYPSFVQVSHQPGGDLIVFTQAFGNTRTAALIRLYDARSGQVEVVGAGFGGYQEPTWRPGGDLFVVSNERGRWVFIDPVHGWVDVRLMSGLLARDWSK